METQTLILTLKTCLELDVKIRAHEKLDLKDFKMKNKSGSRIRRFTIKKINLARFTCKLGNILWIFYRKTPAAYKMYMEGQRARKRKGILKREKQKEEEGLPHQVAKTDCKTLAMKTWGRGELMGME